MKLHEMWYVKYRNNVNMENKNKMRKEIGK
jgi:hypothetical protein